MVPVDCCDHRLVVTGIINLWAKMVEIGLALPGLNWQDPTVIASDEAKKIIKYAECISRKFPH